MSNLDFRNFECGTSSIHRDHQFGHYCEDRSGDQREDSGHYGGESSRNRRHVSNFEEPEEEKVNADNFNNERLEDSEPDTDDDGSSDGNDDDKCLPKNPSQPVIP